MQREDMLEKLPGAITLGGCAAGVAGFIDSIAGSKGHNLGIRNFLPEPIDFPDHGMSWAVASTAALHSFNRLIRKDIPEEMGTASDETQPLQERHESLDRLKIKASASAVGAIAGATLYILLGEVGSEVIHYTYDQRQEDVAEEEREPLRLGHFDPLDVVYGVGSAIAVAKLRERSINSWAEEVRTLLPPVKIPKQRKQHAKALPQANKRYTPPKKNR